ncbi:hypothetical protein Bca4012_062788 [Brassica carinata]
MIPAAESLRPLPLKTQETGESSVRTLVEENALVVIGRRGCCMCHVVKRLLLGLGVNPAVLEIDEEKEEEVMSELKRIGVDGRRETVKLPAVYIGGRLFGGLDRVMATHISGRTSALELNKWAEDHTNGLIKDLLPPGSVSSLTRCVFGNALYFKGAWEVPFGKSYTKDKEFHLFSGTSMSVPFMSSYKNQYIKAYDGFKVLRIPYRQGNDATNYSFPYYQGVYDTSRSFPFNKMLIVPMAASLCIFILQTRMMGWMILSRQWHLLLDSWIVTFQYAKF